MGTTLTEIKTARIRYKMGIREGMGSLRSKDRVLIGQAKLWGGQARLYFVVLNHKRKLRLRTVTKVPVKRVPAFFYELIPFRGSDKSPTSLVVGRVINSCMASRGGFPS